MTESDLPISLYLYGNQPTVQKYSLHKLFLTCGQSSRHNKNHGMNKIGFVASEIDCEQNWVCCKQNRLSSFGGVTGGGNNSLVVFCVCCAV